MPFPRIRLPVVVVGCQAFLNTRWSPTRSAWCGAVMRAANRPGRVVVVEVKPEGVSGGRARPARGLGPVSRK